MKFRLFKKKDCGDCAEKRTVEELRRRNKLLEKNLAYKCDEIEVLRNDLKDKCDEIKTIDEQYNNQINNLKSENTELRRYFKLDEEPPQSILTEVRINETIHKLEIENTELKAKLYYANIIINALKPEINRSMNYPEFYSNMPWSLKKL